MRLFATAAVLALAASLASAEGDDAQALFDKAWAAQDGKKDWAGAHEIYDKILERHEAERSLLARVIYERGVCAARLGKPEDATGDFNGVCSEFEDEDEWCAKALAAAADLRPARKDDDVLAMMKMVQLTVDFQKDAPWEVILFLSEVSDMGIRAEKGAWNEFTRARVSLCVNDVPMLSVVDLIAIQTGVEWTIQGGRIVFALKEEMNGRKRPAPEAAPEMDELLKRRLDDAKVSLQADSVNPNRVIEYLRLATRLPFVAGTALMTDREWRHKPAAADWKDKPVVEALASLGLKARIVNRVIVVEPER